MTVDARQTPADAPASPPTLRRSVGVIIGWILAIPGYLVMAALLLAALGVPDMAGCRIYWNSGDMGCAPGFLGALMEPVLVLLFIGFLMIVSVVGLLPILWSLIYPILRWRARRRTVS